MTRFGLPPARQADLESVLDDGIVDQEVGPATERTSQRSSVARTSGPSRRLANTRSTVARCRADGQGQSAGFLRDYVVSYEITAGRRCANRQTR